MNWNHSRNNPGTWQTMRGTATRYEPKIGQFGDYALGDITDDLGESVQVLFGSNDKSPLPGPQCIGSLAIWGGLYDANTQKYKVMFNSYAQGQQPPAQQASPPPQQAYQPPAPQQAPPTPPQHRQPPQDPTRVSIERQCAWKAACYIAATRVQEDGRGMSLADIEEYAHMGAAFMATGRTKYFNPASPQQQAPPQQGYRTNPEYEEYPEQTPIDQDIPF